jgi:hypothetical protein
MPGDDASVELQDLGFQCTQLTAESGKTRAGHLGKPMVGCIGDDFQQLLDTLSPDRDDPDFAISRPIVEIVCIGCSSESWNLLLGTLVLLQEPSTASEADSCTAANRIVIRSSCPRERAVKAR